MQPTCIDEGKLISSTNMVMIYMSLPFNKALEASFHFKCTITSQIPHILCILPLNHQFLQLRVVTEQKQVFLAFHVQCHIYKYCRIYLYQV